MPSIRHGNVLEPGESELSKQNRQKKKQAKLQRRRQRQKRTGSSSTPVPKQDSLHDLMAELENAASFSNMKQVINPPGQEKMSEVLEQFIEPYMNAVEDVASMQKLVTIAVVAWNAAIMTEEQGNSLVDSILNTMPEEVRKDATQIITEMIQRKHRYFADNRRAIVNARVTDTGDGFHIAVASLMPSEES